MFGRKEKGQKLNEFDEIKLLIKKSLSEQVPDETFPVKTKLTYNSDMDEATITLKYSQERKANLKQLIKKKREFTEEELKKSRFKKNLKLYELETIESEIIPIMIDSNVLKLKIDVTSFSKVATLVGGGNYDFGDDFSRGYTIKVSQKERDVELMKYVVKTLQSRGWGCLYGELTTHGHYNHDFPTIENAQKMLENISLSINSDLETNGLRISIRKNH
ncbi:hypothetical protein YTPLAS73_11190 [Nitrosarchaeum sp.]|nr:hypothetical protein YTPLAS73_11190 [Nitrosarchaeum sp.]